MPTNSKLCFFKGSHLLGVLFLFIGFQQVLAQPLQLLEQTVHNDYVFDVCYLKDSQLVYSHEFVRKAEMDSFGVFVKERHVNGETRIKDFDWKHPEGFRSIYSIFCDNGEAKAIGQILQFDSTDVKIIGFFEYDVTTEQITDFELTDTFLVVRNMGRFSNGNYVVLGISTDTSGFIMEYSPSGIIVNQMAIPGLGLAESYVEMGVDRYRVISIFANSQGEVDFASETVTDTLIRIDLQGANGSYKLGGSNYLVGGAGSLSAPGVGKRNFVVKLNKDYTYDIILDDTINSSLQALNIHNTFEQAHINQYYLANNIDWCFTQSYQYCESRICVTSLDTLGNIHWQKYVGGDASYHATTLRAAPDSGVLLLAIGYDSLINTDEYDMYYLKFDKNGNVEPNYLAPSEYVSIPPETPTVSDFLLYPNPAQDVLYIDYGPQVNPSQFLLYDAMGRMVLQSELPKSRINISHLPQGVYLYNMVGQTGVLHAGKVVLGSR